MLYSLGNILNTVEEIAFYGGETPDSCHWSKCKHLLPHVSAAPTRVLLRVRLHTRAVGLCSALAWLLRRRVWGALLRRSSSEETAVPGRGNKSCVAGS